MKTSLLLTTLVLFSGLVQANDDVYGYARYTPKLTADYLKLVEKNSPEQGPAKCLPMYQPIINKGVLDIRYALGYFDDSTGKDVTWGKYNYGPSPSLDIAIFDTLRDQFRNNCRGDLNLCNFNEVAANKGKSVFEKYINIHGRRTLVRITLTHASASSSFAKNKGPLAGLQKQLTAQSDENFFGGLKTADVVFYNGHSRNGGGPDFNPPILNSLGKVDYDGYYEPKRIGILRTLKSIKENPNKDVLLGMFSCYAEMHFYKAFMNNNPRQKMILSSATIDYFDSLKASVGYLEGILRGSCGQELANTAKQDDKIRGGFQGFQIH